ncbi:MAG: DUF5043 domain-containing protein [Prevotellaceae bacterium]|jgi:hypothetical protein|nr:DUF5043 domain-containing protein [Prevotellaceae bacterium]
MKRITLLLAASLICLQLPAQTRYYQITGMYAEAEYTYQCDVQGKHVRLYNKANKWTYELIRNKTTGNVADIEALLPVLEDDTWTKPKCHLIVSQAFTVNEACMVQNAFPISVSMYINSTTGRIEEILFEFTNIEAFATIPVSVYRKIEVNLKKNVWFTSTANGKTLNYIYRWFEAMPNPKDASPNPPPDEYGRKQAGDDALLAE